MLNKIEHKEFGIINISRRKGSKNIRLSINAKGEIRISIPWFVTKKRALSFLEQNTLWLRDTISKQVSNREALKNSPYTIQAPSSEDEEKKLKSAAKAYLIPRLEELASRFGFIYQRVTLRNNISNWGSCSTRKYINLNINLMSLPEHLRDYVLIHELCHLVHPNHSSDFYNLLNSLLNNKEKELRAELKRYKLIKQSPLASR